MGGFLGKKETNNFFWVKVGNLLPMGGFRGKKEKNNKSFG